MIIIQIYFTGNSICNLKTPFSYGESLGPLSSKTDKYNFSAQL